MEKEKRVSINDCLGIQLLEDREQYRTYRLQLDRRERVRVMISNYCWLDYSASAIDIIISELSVSLSFYQSENLLDSTNISSVKWIREIDLFREPPLDSVSEGRIIIFLEFEGDELWLSR